MRETMDQLGDAGLMKSWKATAGEQTLFEMPKIALIRSIALNQWYHHRGQLSVYLRLLDVPVPSIYGPSADENPFAAHPDSGWWFSGSSSPTSGSPPSWRRSSPAPGLSGAREPPRRRRGHLPQAQRKPSLLCRAADAEVDVA
jgi:hypothetical protein